MSYLLDFICLLNLSLRSTLRLYFHPFRLCTAATNVLQLCRRDSYHWNWMQQRFHLSTFLLVLGSDFLTIELTHDGRLVVMGLFSMLIRPIHASFLAAGSFFLHALFAFLRLILRRALLNLVCLAFIVFICYGLSCRSSSDLVFNIRSSKESFWCTDHHIRSFLQGGG